MRAPGTRRSYVRPSVRLVSVHVRARRPSAPRSPRERARLLSTSTWLGVAWGVVRSVHAAHAPHRIAPHRIQDSRTPGGRPSSLPLVLASRRGGLGARGCGRVRAGVTGSGRGVAVEARGARRTGGLLTAARLCAWTRACGGWSGQGHAGRGTRGQIGRPDACDTVDAVAVAVCVARGAMESKGLGRRDGMEGRGGAGRCVRACGDSEGRDWVCGWDYVAAKTFTESPVLVMLDTKKPFHIECNASDFATGAVLSQLTPDRKWHPCAYISKLLSPTECNYPIYDKELLVVI